MTRPRIEPWFLGLLANTIYMYIYIYICGGALSITLIIIGMQLATRIQIDETVSVSLGEKLLRKNMNPFILPHYG